MPDLQTHFNNSDELCEYMSDLCGSVGLLAFSRGKDSVVAWLKMRRYFKKIVPYFLYSIPPGPLSFEEKSLQYYEDFFECHIIRMPHPAMYEWINWGVFQAPENLRIIEEANLPIFGYDDVLAVIRMTDPAGLEPAYQASGVRSADSIVRRTSMLKHGVVNHVQKTWFPVFDYKKEDMVRELDAANIALPIDYEWFGRTFDGIDWRFTHVLKDKSPEDYSRIETVFPLVELDILRQQYRAEYWSERGVS